MKAALVCGAGGFIGTHLVTRLKKDGYWVRGVDLKRPEFSASDADDFIICDLRDPLLCNGAFDRKFDSVFQLAADMGGAGFVFVGENDAAIMHNSALINLNVLECCRRSKAEKVFYSSSACIYPAYNQVDPDNPNCAEASAYPADPDSEYGWEKLFSERLYLAYHRNFGMAVRIARFHNIFGPLGTWCGGREKAPAAVCRKIAEVVDGGEIEIWGDGRQTRSFLFVDECVEGMLRLVASDWTGPVNIGSDEMISIDGLAEVVMRIAEKRVRLHHTPGPQGVRGRNSDNRLIERRLFWRPKLSLEEGLRVTYPWIAAQVAARAAKAGMSNGAVHAGPDRVSREERRLIASATDELSPSQAS